MRHFRIKLLDPDTLPPGTYITMGIVNEGHMPGHFTQVPGVLQVKEMACDHWRDVEVVSDDTEGK